MADYQQIAEYLLSRLQDKKQSTAEHMARGHAKDYAEYRQLCGLIQGLEFAENLVNDLAKRLLEDADNE